MSCVDGVRWGACWMVWAVGCSLVCLAACDLEGDATGKPPTPEPAAAVEMGETGEAVQSLVQRIGDPAAPAQLRMDAAARLGELGDRRAVLPLVTMLEADLNDRTGMWAAAIPALGALADSRAVPVLLEALELRDDDWLGREMAAAALGEIGDPVAMPALVAAATMGDTRDSAVEALVSIGDPRVATLYVDVLAGGDEPETIAAAKRGLRDLGEAAVPALATVFEAPAEWGEDQALAAAETLGEIDAPSARAVLREAAEDPRPSVRQAAQRALASMDKRKKVR